MGGGFELVTRNNNFFKTSDDLDIVYCSVDLVSGNLALFDRSILFKRFSQTAKKFMEDHGIKSKIEGPAGMGGDVELFFEVVQRLWGSKEIFSILSFIAKWAFNLIIGLPSANRPRVSVGLWIKSNSKLKYVEHETLEAALIGRLINLKNLNDELRDLLEKQYPIFVFDQSVGASLHDISYKINYSIPSEQCSAFNRYRLVRLIKGIKVRINKNVRYEFIRNGLIKRTDRKTSFTNDSWMSDAKSKEYFLFASTRIISDYL